MWAGILFRTIKKAKFLQKFGQWPRFGSFTLWISRKFSRIVVFKKQVPLWSLVLDFFLSTSPLNTNIRTLGKKGIMNLCPSFHAQPSWAGLMTSTPSFPSKEVILCGSLLYLCCNKLDGDFFLLLTELDVDLNIGTEFRPWRRTNGASVNIIWYRRSYAHACFSLPTRDRHYFEKKKETMKLAERAPDLIWKEKIYIRNVSI
jgi:hypothetical protein